MDPKQQEVLGQIQEAWAEAQQQVIDLREQVEYLSRVAMAKAQSAIYTRDLDRSFRDLGEAVWAQVSKGKLQLPQTLSPVMKSLAEVTRKIQEQNQSINDLLAEGSDLADRKRAGAKTVAPKTGKR